MNERLSANKSDADAPIRLIVSANRCEAVVSRLDCSAEASAAATNDDSGSTTDIFSCLCFRVVLMIWISQKMNAKIWRKRIQW